MNESNTILLLSAFATIKSLSDAKRYESPYQILSEFINYIIDIESLYSFNSAEMKNQLNNQFGFIIPEPVVKTAVRRMTNITLENGIYTVSPSEKKSDSLFYNVVIPLVQQGSNSCSAMGLSRSE